MPAIGIDLGTTYCCVGVWQQGKVNIVSNDQGNRTTPSYVAFTDSEKVIGTAAKNQVAKNPKNTLFNIKKLIGRPFNDPKIQYEMKNWPFNVVNDCNMPKLQIDCKGEKKRFAPEEISAMILAKMKATAESYLGESVKDAVISVPAHFNNSQRQATKNAGIIAGLNVLRIINEPTAAALAYGLDKNLKGDRNVLIFDLGGGTLDVSILTISEGSQFKVMATAGNTHLGGEDFSNHIVKHLANEFKRKFHHNIQSNTRALQRLYDAAEHAKQTLSQCTEASVELDALYEGINFYTKLTRAKFEELCADLFRATLSTVGKALNGAKLDKSSINDIVLVGGSTRIPKIQNLLRVFFSKKYLSVSINPDEAVAYGAAVQAAVLSGDQTLPIRDVLLVDVAAFSLCIETVGGVMTKIIKRNARIPCKQSLPFTTYTDNQSVVTIQIFEGNRAKNKSNNLLGTLDLINILPSPQGVPKMDVTFDLDANGILTICAKDRTFGQLMNINVRSDNGQLSSEEINRLAIEVNKYREEDENQIARVAARNHLEEYIFKIKQIVEMHGDNFNESNKSMLLTKCEEALRWLDDNMLVGKEDMEHCQQTLQNACSPFIPIFIAVQEATL